MSVRKTVKRNRDALRIKIEPIDEAARHPTSPIDQIPSPAEVKILFAPGRYLVYSRFNGRDQIHIREYAIKSMMRGMGVCEVPTKKGICLSMNRLKAFRNKIDEIDERLKEKGVSTIYKSHLGAGIYASISELNGVDLRRHWIPEGETEIVPTKRGIYLPRHQWISMKEKLTEMIEKHPILETAEECFHANQMELIDCRECLPFGWMMA